MRGVDINLFQFDWDMTWAAMFMNADQTIYARYGSRASDRDHSGDLVSVGGLRACMERVLALHAGYPGNKALLEGKKGKPLKWRTTESIPNLSGRFKDSDVKKGCIHCHHVTMGLRREAANAKRPIPDNLLWLYPLPENVGVKIAIDDGRRVEAVTKGSAAEKAGILAGDEIESLDGQAITSPADIQWVLQNLSDSASPKTEVKRGSETKTLTLSLSGPWKHYDIAWRESLWDLRSGVVWVPLTADERKNAGLTDKVLGLRANFVGPQGNAKKGGFEKEDILVEVDGKSAAMTEGEVIAYLRQKFVPGSKVPMTVLRKGKRVKLTLELS